MLSKAENIRRKQGAHTFTSIVCHLNWYQLKPSRAGIIPYTFNEDKSLLFGFGLDHQFRELTDFGGGVSYRKDKTALKGAIREFQEESLGVFGEISQESLQRSLVLYTENTLIIFLYMDIHPETINKKFYLQREKQEKLEVSDIVWLSDKELKIALRPQSRMLYVRVSHTLRNAGNFYSILNH